MFTKYDSYSVSQIKPGTVLRDGSTVVEVENFLGGWILVTDQYSHEYMTDQSLQTNVKTNCLYGGNSMGHSHGGFCTADACY